MIQKGCVDGRGREQSDMVPWHFRYTCIVS